MNYTEKTRSELIYILEKFMREFTVKHWDDRDSYLWIINAEFLVNCLSMGLDYEIYNKRWIKFLNITEEDVERFNKGYKSYEREDVDDFHEKIDPKYECEMFNTDLEDLKVNGYNEGYLMCSEEVI